MGAKRRIVVSGLDDPHFRSMVNECLASDHFDIGGTGRRYRCGFNAPCRSGQLLCSEGLGADSGTLRDASVPRRRECPVALLRRSVCLPWHQGASWQRRAEYDHYAV